MLKLLIVNRAYSLIGLLELNVVVDYNVDFDEIHTEFCKQFNEKVKGSSFGGIIGPQMKVPGQCWKVSPLPGRMLAKHQDGLLDDSGKFGGKEVLSELGIKTKVEIVGYVIADSTSHDVVLKEKAKHVEAVIMNSGYHCGIFFSSSELSKGDVILRAGTILMDLLEYAQKLASKGDSNQQQNAQYFQSLIQQKNSPIKPDNKPKNNTPPLIGGLAPPAPSEITTNLTAPEVIGKKIDKRRLNRTGRTEQFATRVTKEWLEKVKNISQQEKLFQAEVLEKALASYEREKKRKMSK
ncbi:3301_t:CDS:2 [Ambispora gerdemannii]|uniref:3301_t:CDS:1 n=1 Tax=Ambispora gerdemannii TaxID=144530 RepID=A0A9N9BTE6_9GLOM|nr:3301_t:CDS:2 [Ambispora gerdemannii]